MNGYYILNGKIPAPASFEEYLQWEGKHGRDVRRVAFDKVGIVDVSTVFLGLNHRFGDGEPLLFETMVFEGPMDGECERCSTWEEAEAQHSEMLERVKMCGLPDDGRTENR